MYNAPMIKEFRQKLEDFIWADMISKRGVPGRVLATVLRYVYAVLRDVFSGQLTLRAMSLVYTTLLSIVPLLAFSFSVLKGLGVHEDLPARLSGLLQPLGDKGVEYTNKLIGIVDNVNGKALAGIGLAFFLYTVISMVQKTEESFNYVWYVSKPRSLARRLAEYLSVLLVGPLLITIAFGMIGVLTSGSLYDYVVNNSFFGPIATTLGSLVPYLIVCTVFTFLYTFMPNTKVKLSAALVGGLAGGFLWATTSALFAAVVVDSTKNNAIYASLAIPIATLIWLYLSWLILLIGSQLAFYFQNPAYLRIGRRDPQLSNSMRERLALNVMFAVGQEFRHPSGGIDIDTLSHQLKIPGLTLSPIVSKLEKAGLLTVTEKEQLQPGREMARISLAEILRVVRIIGETGSYRGPKWSPPIASLGEQLDSAVETVVGEKSLAELLDELETA